MLDPYYLVETRDDCVKNLTRMVRLGNLCDVYGQLDYFADMFGISWRNLAGRIVRMLERMGVSTKPVSNFIEKMKELGVNAPLLQSSAL